MLSFISNCLICLYYILNFYLTYMFIMIILSWIPGINEKPLYRKLSKISDFYLDRFRGFLVFGNIDFTPILGFILLEVVLQMLANYIIPMV